MLRHLLWIDSGAGLLAGMGMLAFSGWLSELYALPRALLVAMGVANLMYGTYSGMLARRSRRPMGLIVLLATANGTWAILCGLAAAYFARRGSGFALAHFVAEGVFVGILAVLEWRGREQLRERG